MSSFGAAVVVLAEDIFMNSMFLREGFGAHSVFAWEFGTATEEQRRGTDMPGEEAAAKAVGKTERTGWGARPFLVSAA